MTRFGQYRPLTGTPAQAGQLMTPDIIGLHTMAGTLAGTDAMFNRNGYGGVFSHFGVGGAGQVYQWQDTELRGAANLNGNHRVISIETADTGEMFTAWSGEDVPAWTEAQLDALARLISILCTTHNIPCELIPDSKPGRRGIAPHRLGINPWRVPLGELWSSKASKVCPGERRLAQLPGLVDRARAVMTGDTEMPLTQADVALIVRGLLDAPLDDLYPGQKRTIPAGVQLALATARSAQALNEVGDLSVGVKAHLEEIDAKLDHLGVGAVDLDALAAKVVELLAARLAQ